MRFPGTQPNDDRGHRAHVRGLILLSGLLVLLANAWRGQSQAQPPGTLPPQDTVQDTDSSGISPDAFFFLDESGVPVMMPGMSWEELERLKNIQDGTQSTLQPFVFESLEIVGTAEDGRAELDVSIELAVDPSAGRRLAIPLQMSNFNLLGVKQVEGVQRHWITVASDGSGYVLWVETSGRSEIDVRLSVAVRVQQSPSSGISFDLPDVPSTVRMNLSQPDLQAEVSGRGDEVVRAQSGDQNGTEFLVESSGGRFDLRWSAIDRGREDSPLLEVDSDVNIRWDDPQDQPTAIVRLRVKDRRGPLSPFEIKLPKGSILLDTPPEIDDGEIDAAEEVEATQPVPGPDGDIVKILVPEESRLNTVGVLLSLQLENSGASDESPLIISVPEVVGALTHEGDLAIEISADYRLRWQSQRWVEAVVTDGTVEGSSRRNYEFNFDRGSVELPVWLAAQRRQLRLTLESEITFRDGTASMLIEMRPNRQAVDGRITFDPAGWTIRSISNLETGELLDSFDAGPFRELTLNSRGGDEPAPIQVFAETEFDPSDETIELTLPQVLEREQNVLVQSSTLTLKRSGRDVFVADLAASTRIDRIGEGTLPQTDEQVVSRFRVLPSDSPATLVGTIVQQSHRVTVDGEATIQLDGQELLTILDWQLSSQFDLEGELIVRIDRPAVARQSGNSEDTLSTDDDVGEGVNSIEEVTATGDNKDGGLLPPASVVVPPSDLAESYQVRVDDLPAELRPIGDDLYRLISDRLASDPVSVQWQLRQLVDSPVQPNSIVHVPIPRPVRNDVAVEGGLPISLSGDAQTELLLADGQQSTEAVLDTLPREPLRLALQSRSTEAGDLSVLKAVVRTAVGGEARHEQLVATVQGSDLLRLRLPRDARSAVVKAWIDARPTEFTRRDDQLLVPLPTDDAEHRVDVQVWLSKPLESALELIEPVLGLPPGVDQVYWQLTVPRSLHVVWSSPSAARAMRWQFGRWSWHREPIETDESLVRWAGGREASIVPPGNQYLYYGPNIPAFGVRVATKGLIWQVVGATVLLAAVVLTYVPRTRHPLVAVVVLVALGGLLAYSPDAAVIAGQLAAIASILVIVMLAIRSLLGPHATQPSSLAPPSKSERMSTQRDQPPIPDNGKQLEQPVDSRRSSVSETQALQSPSPSEVVS